ncbi:TetR/AcrR family transcriptional regulator [Altererythrobacter arenosus]|uniref:TetR/AcrR family transcriptional regulator n=1 Tax=Altererythrobacter arenosus TaxID=3032592 RepID=A0ABY8FN00_9SPHN|nr:TetR/AcrR family transcriptional regulator [Altererythrobacter sp. CAU 1644]WFL76232.1 TetR/AcrR family transcriptional regulator [Altererythrobacter sp. CAU 1644]
MVQSRSEETRNRVLDATRELLMAHGFNELTMKHVQEKSGISNGSIFHHFGSKEGIVREIFIEERRLYLGAIADAIVHHEGDPCDAFAAGARRAVDYQLQDIERFMRLVADFSDSEWLRANKELWLDAANDIQRPVVEWAMPHFASGALPLLPPTVFQSLSLGPAEFITRSQRQGRIENALEHVDSLAAAIGAGLKHLRDLQAETQPT